MNRPVPATVGMMVRGQADEADGDVLTRCHNRRAPPDTLLGFDSRPTILSETEEVGTYDDLEDRLRSFSSVPFLFVGAGLSRRYLGTDGWVDLLKRMAAHTGKPYAYFASKADNRLPLVASEIAREFHEIWWNSEHFKESQELYGDTLQTREGPLKVEVARYTEAALERIPTTGALGKELRVLREAVVDGAITTNYDGLLEYLFPEFKAFVGQDELLFSDVQGVGEIYKIHGSATRPESLILTERDYDGFNNRNPYLAAKLVTIFVEHPIVFLGYSLSDPDVTDLLVSVAQVLTTENLRRLSDRLIFIQWDPSRAPSLTSTQIAVSGFSIPLVLVNVPDFEETFAVLTRLSRRFSARLLRQLKEKVYEMALSGDASERFAVVDIDDSTRIEDVEFVVGVGIQKQLGARGYVGLTREELLKDVLRPVSEYEASKVVEEALPQIMRQPGNVPIYRYLRLAGLLNDDGTLKDGDSVHVKVSQRVRGATPFRPSAGALAQARRIALGAKRDLEELIKREERGHVLLAATDLQREELDLDKFRQYLVENADAFYTQESTAWSKAACLYDYYRFGITARTSQGEK